MKTRKLTACLLAAAMGTSFCGMLTAHALHTTELYGNNIVSYDESVKAVHHNMHPYQPMKLYSARASETTENVELPDQYDPRGHKTMTGIKAQGEYGTCWSFSAMASIESTLFDYDPYVDLSEWHLAYYTYADGIGYPKTMPDLPWYDQGAYLESSCALLLSGIGPVDESDFPYGNMDITDPAKTADALRAESDYRVTDVTYYPYTVDSEEFEAQKNAVKLALRGGQELGFSYLDHNDVYDAEHCSYYFPYDEELIWYANGHAVNLIGWDDNYPAENFVTQPSTDGAWLAKNSWGSGFGDDGYFWISYEDPTICDITAYTAVPAETYNDVYQYDHFGYGATLYQDYLEFENAATTVSDSAMMANVFTAEKDTVLESVMFATAMADEAYEITIFTGLTDNSDPTSGTAHPITAGMMPQMGYHTVELSQAVPLTEGELFSVVVKLSGAEGYHLTGEVCSYGEYLGSDGSVVEMGDTAASLIQIGDIAENQSFISLDGTVWEDTCAFQTTEELEAEFSEEALDPDYEFIEYQPTKITKMYGNVCIKALTRDADCVEFSTYVDTLVIGDAITLSNSDGRPIFYAVNDGEMQQYTAPIPFDGDMTIRACTEGSDTIYEQHYSVRRASLTALNISEGESEEYWYFTGVTFSENNGRYEGEFGYYYIPGYDVPAVLAVKPSGYAEVICNGQKLINNEVNLVPVNTEDPKNALVFQVSSPGMEDGEYVVSLYKQHPLNNGDVDENGIINAQDAAAILVYAAEVGANGEPEEPDWNFIERGDVVYDNEITALDAAEVLIRAAIEGAY